MNPRYEIVEERFLMGNETRISYGLVAYADSDKEATATIVASAHDLTNDKCRAQLLAKKCNRGRLSLCHFQEIIEDFLAY